jgi:hypothetical protein
MLAVVLALALLQHTAASIEDIDFANLTFPSFAGLESVPLKDGDFCSHPLDDPTDETCVSLIAVAFGDLTGDGHSEAAVTIGAVFRLGNGSHTTGFVYTLDEGRPRLIGRFAGGDRWDGSIGKVRIRGGRLLVTRAHGRGENEEDTFRWNGRHLVLVSSSVHSVGED